MLSHFIMKQRIITDSGIQAEAIAPVIISASRSTDIPAFYAQWFFNRLAKGYCAWYNPFNRRKMYVSFANCKVVVFWTKNPAPILPYLHLLDERGIHYYFQMTLNDYEREGFEPGLPPLEKRIETFKRLSERIGPERVIWRFDPLILTPGLTPRCLLNRIWKTGNALKGYTDKLVFSFVDVKAYRKVQNKLVKETSCFSRENVLTAEPNTLQRQELVVGLAKLRDAWHTEGWKLALATCAEDTNLESYGIGHNSCIDRDLLMRLFVDDEELMYYMRYGQLPERDMFGQLVPKKEKDVKSFKDKGQRPACGCMVSKDIGMYDTCRHFCVYCYANTSRECVEENVVKHSDDGESLLG